MIQMHPKLRSLPKTLHVQACVWEKITLKGRHYITASCFKPFLKLNLHSDAGRDTRMMLRVESEYC